MRAMLKTQLKFYSAELIELGNTTQKTEKHEIMEYYEDEWEFQIEEMKLKIGVFV